MSQQAKDTNLTINLSGHHWGWLLAFGILFIFLGMIGLGMAVALTIASMIFFGVLLIIGGVSHAIDALRHKAWKGSIWQIMIAILYFIAGGLIIYDPLFASSVITIFLGVTLITIGLIRIIMSLVLKDIQGWGWVLLAGLAALILGILLLAQWPASGFWFIGMLIAIELIITGWTYVFISLSMRSKMY